MCGWQNAKSGDTLPERVTCFGGGGGMNRALDEMRTQFAAFLADPEGYDRQREMCDRVALAKACIDEIDELNQLRVTIDIIGALAADAIARHGISHAPQENDDGVVDLRREGVEVDESPAFRH